MKIALYIEDGAEQVVLTAENKFEQAILDLMTDGTRTHRIFKGNFHIGKSQGGWFRQFDYREQASTMILMQRPEAEAGASGDLR